MKKYCYNPKRTLTVLLGSVGVATALGVTPSVAMAAPTDATNTSTASEAVTENSLETNDQNATVEEAQAKAAAPSDGSSDVEAPAASRNSENTDHSDSSSTPEAGNADTGNDSATDEGSEDTETPVIPERTIEDTSVVIGTKMDETHVLDANGGYVTDGTKVTLWTSNAGNNQKWDVTYDEKTGYYFVGLHNTNQVLDVQFASSKPGAAVTMYHKTGADNQLWKIEEKDGYYRFLSKLNEELALNIFGASKSDGAKLIVWSKTGAANEWFRFLPINPEVQAGDSIEEGLYTLSAGSATSGVVVSSVNGDRATLSKYAKSDGSQRIYVTSAGDGFYKLMVSASGKYLEAKDGNLVATTPVVQNSYTGSNAQKWALKKLSNGGYSLINKATGLALDVMYNNISAGGVLETYYTKGYVNQTFFFTKVTNIVADAPSTIIADGSYLLQSVADKSKVIGTQGDVKTNANLVVKGNAQFGYNVLQFNRVGSTDYYTITVAGTGKALDVQYAAGNDGRNVELYTASGQDNQLWRLVKINGAFSVVSKLRPDLVLDLYGNSTREGNSVIVYQATGSANQLFNLISTKISAPNGVEVEEGVYNLNVGATGSVYLDVANVSKDNGANVLGYSKTDGANQKFYLKKVNDKNQYNIISINSGKLLDVEHNYILPGTNVIQWEATGGDNQKWVALQNPDGSYSFVNVSTGLTLSLDGGVKSGSNLVGTTAQSGSAVQKFKLEKTQYINDGIYEINPIANTAKSLDIVGNSNKDGAKLELWKDADSLNQRFQVVYDAATDTYRIRTGASGGWLSSDGTDLKSIISQKGNSKTSATDNDRWQAIWNGAYFSLKNVATGGVLSLTGTYDGALLNTVAATGSKLQHFLFTAAGLLQNGLYQIVNKSNNKLLDVSGDARYAGANVGVYQNNNGGNQKFNIVYRNGAYVITGALSKLAVAVSGGSDADGANVIQDKTDYGADQLWTAEIADGGGVIFVNQKSGKALTASGSNAVQKQKSYTSSTDTWTLNPTFLSGWVYNGGWIYYYENGSYKRFTDSVRKLYDRVQSISSSSQYLLAVDRWNYRVGVFKGSRGNWVPIGDWLCAVGKDAPGYGVTTPGIHYIRRKGYSRGENPEYYYWSEFWVPNDHWAFGGQRFHSYLYDVTNGYKLHTDQVGSVTEGCVRLDIENSYWIWKNCPIGTTVFVV